MSLRSYINHHLRQATLYCWVASIAGIVAVFTAGRRDVFTVALVVCVMLYAVAYYYTFSTRCPRCGTRLLFALGSFGIHLRLPAWFKSCPSCGLSFEAQRDEPAKA